MSDAHAGMVAVPRIQNLSLAARSRAGFHICRFSRKRMSRKSSGRRCDNPVTEATRKLPWGRFPGRGSVASSLIVARRFGLRLTELIHAVTSGRQRHRLIPERIKERPRP